MVDQLHDLPLRRRSRASGSRDASRAGRSKTLRATKSAELETWLAGAPALQADDPALMRTYRASLSDLGALRMHPDLAEARRCPRQDCRGSWRCSVATA